MFSLDQCNPVASACTARSSHIDHPIGHVHVVHVHIARRIVDAHCAPHSENHSHNDHAHSDHARNVPARNALARSVHARSDRARNDHAHTDHAHSDHGP